MDIFTLILCLSVGIAKASGHFKFYKIEKAGKIKVREFEMEQTPFTTLGKRNVLQQRGNFTTCVIEREASDQIHHRTTNSILLGTLSYEGDPKDKFSIQWEPKVLNTQGVATVYWDLVAPIDLVSGNVELVAWLPGQPDTPILNIGQKGTCGDLKSIIPTLTCPIKKNDISKNQFTFRDLRRLPTGKFDIEFKITNAKNEVFLCGRTSLELIP